MVLFGVSVGAGVCRWLALVNDAGVWYLVLVVMLKWRSQQKADGMVIR